MNAVDTLCTHRERIGSAGTADTHEPDKLLHVPSAGTYFVAAESGAKSNLPHTFVLNALETLCAHPERIGSTGTAGTHMLDTFLQFSSAGAYFSAAASGEASNQPHTFVSSAM